MYFLTIFPVIMAILVSVARSQSLLYHGNVNHTLYSTTFHPKAPITFVCCSYLARPSSPFGFPLKYASLCLIQNSFFQRFWSQLRQLCYILLKMCNSSGLVFNPPMARQHCRTLSPSKAKMKELCILGFAARKCL